MPKALAITRVNHTAAELRESNDADATRRMLALAPVLEGHTLMPASRRSTIACACPRRPSISTRFWRISP